MLDILPSPTLLPRNHSFESSPNRRCSRWLVVAPEGAKPPIGVERGETVARMRGKMNGAPVQRKGLLLATMEPPPAIEEEFQDWYDTEHFPERASAEGFLTAARFVCLEGWPRYLALYDLADVEVLRGPAYAAIAGSKYSAWTRRIVSKVWGQYRAEGVQIYPGGALLGEKGAAARLVVWRFRQPPPTAEPQILEGLRALYESRAETAQVRLFVAQQPDGIDYIGIVELRTPAGAVPVTVSMLGDASRFVDMVNVYAQYRRKWPAVMAPKAP